MRPSRFDRRDGERRLLKKRAKRTSAARRPSRHPRPGPRLSTSVREAPGMAVGRRRPGGTAGPAGWCRCGLRRSTSKISVAHVAGGRRDEAAGGIAGHDVGEAQAARAELGQIEVEPAGERRVHVDDLADGIDREEAGRRMVEIVDGVLQFLEDVLLALAIARDVGDGPERRSPVGRATDRTRTRYQPKRARPPAAARADLLGRRWPPRAAWASR